MSPVSLSLFALVHAACAIDFYVSPAGSDVTGDGSSSNPWATPLPSLSAIESSKSNGLLPSDVTVHLESGTYFLSVPLNVSSGQGGDGVHTVTFAGPADPTSQPAILSAGAPVEGPWTAVPAAPGVFSAPIPPGVSLLMVRQMWDAATNTRVRLARTDIGFAVKVGQWGAGLPPGALTPADVPALAEAELVLWHNWVTSQNKILSVNATNSSILVRGEAGDPFFGAGGTFRYALQNVADPLKLAAGSFYVSNRVLFYRPADGSVPTQGSMIVERITEAVMLSGAVDAPVQGVSFVNLTIAHAAADLEHNCLSGGCGGQSCSESSTAAFHATFASSCALTGVDVVGSGAYAVWWDEGSVDCSISYSWLHDLGMGGVRVGNTVNVGSYAAEPTRSVTVTDNTIEDGGHIVPAGTGVLAQESLATKIVHNHIHHLFYTGVSTGWTWGYAADSSDGHTVGWNHIHDIFQRELSDGGCIYNLGRSPNTTIVNNLCHDVDSYGYGAWGLYTDEGSSNVTLRDNIVYHTKDAAFHQHYGTDNLITNNIFAFPSSLFCNTSVAGQCDQSAVRSSQHMDCWNPTPPTTEDYGCNSSFTFSGNIVYLGGEEGGNLTKTVWDTFTAYNRPGLNGLTNMTFGSNLYWSSALADPVDDIAFGTQWLPLNFSAWVKWAHDDGSAVADPLFANAAALNFTLLPGSPALAMGFQQIDMSSVGPRAPFRHV